MPCRKLAQEHGETARSCRNIQPTVAGTEQQTADDLLFVGDVHLGRRPVGLDEVLAEFGVERRDLSPAAALANLVDEALARPPRAVIFAGDLVDQDEDRFEAYSILEREVRRLREAHIPVLAVAGNHDGIVLPQLIERVEGVQLIGAGGQWERVELAGPGQPVDLLGWSFPGRHFKTCPLDHESFEAAHASLRPEAAALGVVHGDLGASASSYAPIPHARLDGTTLAAWFLGHVHKPGELTAERPIGYLGSLTGLHANETGPRGPWRVRPEPSGVTAQQVHLAPVRWEAPVVALEEGDVLDIETLHRRIEASVLEQLSADSTLFDPRLKLIVARVELTGRLAQRDAVRELVAGHHAHDMVFRLEHAPVIVQSLRDLTRKAIDLEARAGEATAIGHVARCLLELRAGGGGEQLGEARRTIERFASADWNIDEEDHPLPSPEQLLERAAWSVLDVLLEQREEAGRL